jgi:hypothetical protein
MDISWWRDLVIVILGFIATVAIVFLSIISFMFYRRTMTLMNSANEVVDKVSVIVDYTEKEIMQPILQFGTVIQGVVQGVSFFTNLFRKKEDSYE